MKKLILLLVIVNTSSVIFAQDTLTYHEDFYRSIYIGPKTPFITGLNYTVGIDKKRNVPKTNPSTKGSDGLFWTSKDFAWEKIDTTKLGYFEVSEKDTVWLGFSFYHPNMFTEKDLVDLKENHSFSRMPGYGYLCYSFNGFKTYTELYNFIFANKKLLFIDTKVGYYRVTIHLVLKIPT